jgi:hypothetical protein
MMSHRKMSVNGSFYPDSCEQIEQLIAEFDSLQKESHQLSFSPKAIISPHAGYVYSGFTANCAYKLIDKSRFKRVVVIGPSHRVYLKGASVAMYDNYDTPCGSLEIDIAYSEALRGKYGFLTFQDNAHQEHSTETQMPFVKHYLPDVKVVEIVYGDIRYEELVPLMQEVLDDTGTLLIISTDLSHFYSQKDANTLDSICLDAVKNLNLSLMDQGCEACGIIGVKALIKQAKSSSLKSQLIDYRTSYDASGDATSVVGYMSALVG